MIGTRRSSSLAAAVAVLAVVAAGAAGAVGAVAGCSGTPDGGEPPSPIERGTRLVYRIDGVEGQQAVLETTAVIFRRFAGVGVERARLSILGEGRFGITLDESETDRLPRLKAVLAMQGDLRVQVVAEEQDAARMEAIQRLKGEGSYDATREPLDVVAATARESGRLLVENGEGLFRAPVEDAFPSKDDLQAPAVGFSWREEDAPGFGDFTERHTGRSVAIIVDGEARSTPVIRERIGRQGRISGEFSEDEARDLALVLKAGRLPSKPVLESETTFGPGEDSLPPETDEKPSKE